MKKIVNRVLLCTSALQVVNARAAMNFNTNKEYTYNDYVITINPHNIELSIKMIQNYAKILNYKKVIDASHIIHGKEMIKYFKKFHHLKTSNRSTRFKKMIKNNYLKKTIISLEKIIEKFIGKVDEIYLRGNYKKEERLIFLSLKQNPKFYKIEDGLADYFKINYLLVNYNEIKDALYTFITKNIIKFIKKNLSEIKFIYPKFDKKFSNIAIKKQICIKNQFYKVIKNISKKTKQKKIINKKIVLIIGVPLMILPGRYTMNKKKEINIYNKIIEKIKKTHLIKSNQIYYKHHPRLTYEKWLYKKNNLNCMIYPYKYMDITEVDFLKFKIISIYSLGSTSLLYGKHIFNINSNLIDVSHMHIHKSHFHRSVKLFKDYGINTIKLDY